jgi:hypothetical protein
MPNLAFLMSWQRKWQNDHSKNGAAFSEEDMATNLVSKSSGLTRRLHPVLRASVGDLVRAPLTRMGCYCSFRTPRFCSASGNSVT